MMILKTQAIKTQTLLFIITLSVLYLADSRLTIKWNDETKNDRNLVSSIKKYYCIGGIKNCSCPYDCVEQVKDTNYCVDKKCYTYDNNLGICKNVAHNHVTPLVLQAVPFTGVFGSGFGNIGRWDLFGVYISILFGGCCFICILSCIIVGCQNDEDELNPRKPFYAWCFSCIWVIILLTMYILGIVWTATPNLILDGNGCPLLF
tara:strand:- start:760 stop:1371 length:612 start_codon:yes stop_codon:yes gene_type:complete